MRWISWVSFSMAITLVPALGLAVEPEPDDDVPAEGAVLLDRGELGVSLQLPSFTHDTRYFDDKGKKHDFDDTWGDATTEARGVGISSAVVDLKVSYGVIDGLEVGAHLPLVRNSMTGRVGPTGNLQELDATSSGLGDVSFYLGYEARPFIDETRATMRRNTLPVNLGAIVFAKLPTGKWDDLDADEMPLGTGHTNVGAELFLERFAARGSFAAKAGALARLAREDEVFGTTFEIDPGDVFYAEAGGTRWITSRIAIRAALLYHQSAATRIDDDEVEDSEEMALSVAPGLVYQASEKLHAAVDLRMNRAGSGLGWDVDTGIPLMGKNQLASRLAPVTVTIGYVF